MSGDPDADSQHIAHTNSGGARTTNSRDFLSQQSLPASDFRRVSSGRAAFFAPSRSGSSRSSYSGSSRSRRDGTSTPDKLASEWHATLPWHCILVMAACCAGNAVCPLCLRLCQSLQTQT